MFMTIYTDTLKTIICDPLNAILCGRAHSNKIYNSKQKKKK
jgi:hypothetical protein